MTDREQMTPEALALQMETWQGWTRPRRDAAAAHLRRIAALERENARLEAEADRWVCTLDRYREALHIIRITGPEREAGLAREALAGAPDEECLMPDRKQMTPEEEYETKRLKDILWLEDRIAALERENTDLRDELRLLRLATGSRADRAALRREALAGAPDAPDAQEGT